MINKGLVSDDSDEDDENSEFAEFMRWKKQKRKAQRRGVDDAENLHRRNLHWR